MSWLKLTIACTSEDLEEVTAALEQAGAEAVTISDAADEPLFDLVDGNQPTWHNNQVSGLFSDQHDEATVRERLAAAYAPRPLPVLVAETLADQDWARSWMDRYEPIDYGHGLWVCPTWCEIADPDATKILLDPGLAFGSGNHETTTLCLRWLAANPPREQLVMDYGCGSGVLAITALKLGARQATGIDIDDQALTASRSNAELNGVSDRLRLQRAKTIGDSGKYDIVIANILANTIIELKAELVSLLNENGKLVLSGILREQATHIMQNFYEFDQVLSETRNDWVMLILEKRNDPRSPAY